MPSHPDRVRRNYHHVDAHSVEIHSKCVFEIKVHLSKMEIASWVSPREMAEMMGKKVYREVLGLTRKPV